MENPNELSPDDQAALAGRDSLLSLENHAGWRLLMHRLSLEADEARDRLVEQCEADPMDTKKINSFTNKVLRYKWFAETISELIAEGDALESQHDQGTEHYGEETF